MNQGSADRAADGEGTSAPVQAGCWRARGTWRSSRGRAAFGGRGAFGIDRNGARSGSDHADDETATEYSLHAPSIASSATSIEPPSGSSSSGHASPNPINVFGGTRGDYRGRGRGRGDSRGDALGRGRGWVARGSDRGAPRGGFRGQDGRGGFRGQDGRGAPARGLAPRPALVLPPAKDLMDALEPRVLGVLDARTLRLVNEAEYPDTLPPFVDTDAESAAPENVRCLASYAWTDAHTPTILVPGHPRVWTDLQVPFQAPRDVDVLGDFTYFKDQNGYRLQAYSLLPILAAADALASPADTPVDWRATDYIMDRNAMRKLLHLLDPGQRELRDFRLDAQRVGARTVLLELAQWEPRHIERPHPHTFGAGFVETATAPPPGCEGATGYFRVASYDFGDLRMLVRYGVEACYPPPASEDIAAPDALGAAFTGLSLRTPASTASLHVVHAGTRVPGSRMLEVNTRSTFNPARSAPAEVLSQLLLAEGGAHMLGMHTRGQFVELRETRAGDSALAAEEAEVRRELARLRRVLEEIQAFLCAEGRGVLISFVCVDGVLRAYRRRGEVGMLPLDVMGRFGEAG